MPEVLQVYKLMLAGHSKADLIEALPAMFPGRDIRAIIEETVDCFIAVAAEPKESLIGWSLEATRDLYRKCVEVGDYTGALACVKEVARLATLKR